MASVEESQKSESEAGASGYIVYRERWLVVGVVALLNVTNAILWLSYAPIANTASKYYGVEEKNINWLALVFPISTVVSGLLAVRLVDKRGLAYAIIAGAVLSGLGASIRMTDSFIGSYPLAISGQAVAALAQPFLLCIPTKLAEVWFPDKQRLLVTSFVVMSSVLGQLIGSGVTPIVVDDVSCGINCVNKIWSVPAILSMIIAILLIRNSTPPTPPSGSAAVTVDYPYADVIFKLVTSWNFLTLMLATGSILGISDLIVASMEEILCARGFDNDFAGYCSIALLTCGLFGATFTSFLVGRKIKLIVAMKVLLPLMLISFSAFIMTSRYDFKYMVLTSSGLVGFFGYAAFPVGLELSAEYCFRVIPEATSTGFIIICGHVQGLFYLLLREYASKNLDSVDAKKEVCTRFKELARAQNIQPQDDSAPLLSILGITILFGLLFLTIFNIKLRRTDADSALVIAGITDTQDELDGARSRNAWEASLIYS